MCEGMAVFQKDKMCLTPIAGGNHKFNEKVTSFAKPGKLRGRYYQCHVSLCMRVVLGGSGEFFWNVCFCRG